MTLSVSSLDALRRPGAWLWFRDSLAGGSVAHSGHLPAETPGSGAKAATLPRRSLSRGAGDGRGVAPASAIAWLGAAGWARPANDLAWWTVVKGGLRRDRGIEAPVLPGCALAQTREPLRSPEPDRGFGSNVSASVYASSACFRDSSSRCTAVSITAAHSNRVPGTVPAGARGDRRQGPHPGLNGHSQEASPLVLNRHSPLPGAGATTLETGGGDDVIAAPARNRNTSRGGQRHRRAVPENESRGTSQHATCRWGRPDRGCHPRGTGTCLDLPR